MARLELVLVVDFGPSTETAPDPDPRWSKGPSEDSQEHAEHGKIDGQSGCKVYTDWLLDMQHD